jgi:hypothetical protein
VQRSAHSPSLPSASQSFEPRRETTITGLATDHEHYCTVSNKTKTETGEKTQLAYLGPSRRLSDLRPRRDPTTDRLLQRQRRREDISQKRFPKDRSRQTSIEILSESGARSAEQQIERDRIDGRAW